ncbi:aldehyde dehydrogenase family protein, partial [Thioclava sp. BHET1]
FGPVAVTGTFRTPSEAVELANNTRYGLAASIWTENVSLALDIAARVKAGVVWINGTNMFDAAAPFGGFRESGFGREGGRAGLYDYLRPGWEAALPKPKAAEPFAPVAVPEAGATAPAGEGIDRTMKLYIGGKQARPDGGHSYRVTGPKGAPLGLAPLGSRKDIRNAVEAAAKAQSGWGGVTAHNRAQVLYYIAENLDARRAEIEQLLSAATDASAKRAAAEVAAAIARIFWYAAQADKVDGGVQATRSRHVTMTVNEPWGVMGLICPEDQPLLGFVSMVLPAIEIGNAVVVVPSARHPLIAGALYQVFDTSDLPGGVVNIVTGQSAALARTLAEHDEVAALWHCGTPEEGAEVERSAAGNLKAVWSD